MTARSRLAQPLRSPEFVSVKGYSEGQEQDNADDDRIMATIIGELGRLRGKKIRRVLRVVWEELDDEVSQS